MCVFSSEASPPCPPGQRDRRGEQGSLGEQQPPVGGGPQVFGGGDHEDRRDDASGSEHRDSSPPILSRLRGSLKGVDVADYRRYLERKYR